MITVDYSATFHVWCIYRFIFFIWIHYFEFFTYVCLTWCSILWYCSCWVVTHCIFYAGCSLLIHCNISYHIVLQILLCLFFWHKMYIYYIYEYIYIYVSMWEWYFYRYLWHICQFFTYLMINIFTHMYCISSFSITFLNLMSHLLLFHFQISDQFLFLFMSYIQLIHFLKYCMLLFNSIAVIYLTYFV